MRRGEGTVKCFSGSLAVTVYPRQIRLHDLQTGALVRGIVRHGEQHLLLTSGGELVAWGDDSSLSKWALAGLAEPRLEWKVTLDTKVSIMAELAGGRLVLGSTNGTTQVLDAATGAVLSVAKAHKKRISAIVSLGDNHPTGAAFLTASLDAIVCLWGADGALHWSREKELLAYCFSLSPCGTMVAAGCGDGSLALFRIADWKEVWGKKMGHAWAHFGPKDYHGRPTAGKVLTSSFSPNGLTIACGCLSGVIGVASARTGAVLRTFRAHAGPVVDVLFSADSSRVYSGAERTIFTWKIYVPQEARLKSFVDAASRLPEEDGQREKLLGLAQRVKRVLTSACPAPIESPMPPPPPYPEPTKRQREMEATLDQIFAGLRGEWMGLGGLGGFY